MKKTVLCILLIISLSLCGCDLLTSQEKYDEIYEEGYNDGYLDGKSDHLKEDFMLLWFPTYLNNGKNLRNYEECKSGLVTIRLFAEEVGDRMCILNVDFKLSDVDDMSVYADSDAVSEMFEATCWVFDNHSYVYDDKLFVNNYTFTYDGYLSDQIVLYYGSNSDSVSLILFLCDQVMAIEFDPFS